MTHWPGWSAGPPHRVLWDLYRRKFLLSPSWKQIMMRVNSPPVKETKSFQDVLACTRMLKTLSRDISGPVLLKQDRQWDSGMSDSMYRCLQLHCSTLTGCLKSSIFCRSLRPTTGEQNPVIIREVRDMQERGWEKFVSVCTSANVAIVESGINPTISYTVQGTEHLNTIKRYLKLFSQSKVLGDDGEKGLQNYLNWWLLCWCKSYQVGPFHNGASMSASEEFRS